MSRSGLPLALLSVAALAAAGEVVSRRKAGSRASLSDYLQQYGAKTSTPQVPPQVPPQGQIVGTTRAKVNPNAMWKLAAEKLYGSYVDVPLIATREALQNSRDAIQQAIRARQIGAKDGVFKVDWDAASRSLAWDDNGIGMSRETVDAKFLSLGDTTKIATAQRSEIQAGGFGLAKAILLGASKTFTWTLDTRDHQFRAKGFDEDIQIRKTPFRQGTRLAVFEVDPKYDRFYSSGRNPSIPERITAFLATNKVPFTLLYNGVPVPYAFSGRGSIVEEGANWGPGVTGTVRVYKRSEEGGNLYVRLFGLTQFSTRIAGGKADFDVTVDIETTLAPTEDGYPFTASRMALSGPANETYHRILEQFNVDLLSASKGEKAEFVGDDAVDPQKKSAAERRVAELLRGIQDDPQIQAMLAEMEKTGASVRQAFRQVERQIPSRPASQQSRSTAGTTPEAFQDLVESVNTAAPPPQTVHVSRRRSDGGSNPFAGAGKLKVNAAQWDKKRLAPYLKNPDALLPLLTLWRLSVQLVFGTVRHAPAFEVGFLFDDERRAEYQSEPGLRLFSLNPVPVVKLVQALPNAPEVVAAYLHNKAAHEVTHAMGQNAHDEGFSSTREGVADRTAQLLAPLTLITAHLLGMRMPSSAAPAKPKAPRKKPEAKVKMRKSWSGTQALILERAENEKKSPLYAFSVEFARLFSEAGFPTQLDEEHAPEEDFKIRLYTDVVDGYNDATQIILTFYKDDFSGPGFYGTEWREVLTPAQLDLLREGTPTSIPLASQAVAFLQKQLPKAGYWKPGAGSSNRKPLSRRALVRQADAILARG